MSDFFTKEAAQGYDERNKRLAPIADNMHFLIRMVLQDLPVQARMLCIGVGTGAEILSLAEAHPEWTFVGVDPSASMLEVCRERLKKAGVIDRCALINGYVQDAPKEEKYDAALSVLVGHFVKRQDRVDYYRQMMERLKPGGYLINTEISFDLDSPEFPSMLKNWERVQAMMGATPESLASLPKQLREMLTVLPPAETDSLLQQAGATQPVRFFQSMMIHGWYSRKG